MTKEEIKKELEITGVVAIHNGDFSVILETGKNAKSNYFNFNDFEFEFLTGLKRSEIKDDDIVLDDERFRNLVILDKEKLEEEVEKWINW